MQVASTRKLLFALVAAGALCLAAILAFTGSASAKHQKGSGDAEIKMVFKKGDKAPSFKGDESVEAGQKLEIVNTSNPKDIGPHTFTLVTRKDLPATKNQMKKCGKFQLEVCQRVLRVQRANPMTGEVKKPNVDKGKKGWDRRFGFTGDTWFTQEKGDSESRKVSAKAGTTLYYFCVVHPEMNGKIKVVK